MAIWRSHRVLLTRPRRADGQLSVVRVEPWRCVLSTGEELVIKWSKLQALVEQSCQDQWPIQIRSWWTPDGSELIELHRTDQPPCVLPTTGSPSVF